MGKCWIVRQKLYITKMNKDDSLGRIMYNTRKLKRIWKKTQNFITGNVQIPRIMQPILSQWGKIQNIPKSTQTFTQSEGSWRWAWGRSPTSYHWHQKWRSPTFCINAVFNGVLFILYLKFQTAFLLRKQRGFTLEFCC